MKRKLSKTKEDPEILEIIRSIDNRIEISKHMINRCDAIIEKNDKILKS